MKLAILGFRGNVGQALLERMFLNNDFEKFECSLFSSSDSSIFINSYNLPVYDLFNIDKIALHDIIICLQGSDFSRKIFNDLSKLNYRGFFIDTSSAFRNQESSILALDIVNYDQIISGLAANNRLFSGMNCTCSLLAIAIEKLLRKNLVKDLFISTYQAASGAGYQMVEDLIDSIDNKNTTSSQLAYNVLPSIDLHLEDGSTAEERKLSFEMRKLFPDSDFNVYSQCVRVPVIRSHCLSVHLVLNQDINLHKFIEHINHNPWVEVIDNNRLDTLNYLTPIAATKTMYIKVGRIRRHNNYTFSLFIVGDQLIWGAAEPPRRLLYIIDDFCKKSFC